MTGPSGCPGPIRWMDQGIQVCETCGEVDPDSIAHIDTPLECFTNSTGRCVLRVHSRYECTRPRFTWETVSVTPSGRRSPAVYRFSGPDGRGSQDIAAQIQVHGPRRGDGSY